MCVILGKVRKNTFDVTFIGALKRKDYLNYMETMSFEQMELPKEILRAVKDMGFEEASPIQTQAIPVALTGVDILGQAQTGTGKTAAFGIPVLSRIDPKVKKLQAVILSPTRELAIQISEEMHKMSKYMHGIKILPIYGGQDIVRQIKGLKSGVQVVIGTPGRVMDHMRRKTVKFDKVKMVVLDEADEMLNMGFVDDIETILRDTPSDRQTLLFSATMSSEIKNIAKNYQKDATLIKITKKELTVPKIEQYYYEVKAKNKEEALCRLLDMYNPKLSLVFCNTKKKVDELVESLKERGYFAEGLHGDLKQHQRDRVMRGFKSGGTDILVATDVAARGIDVDDVEAVFNYDVPQDDEYYVHRIGRTGRAGREGRAFTFVVGREIYKLKDIMKYCKTKIKLAPVPSAGDVRTGKIEKILTSIDDIIVNEDLDDMLDYVEDWVNECDYTSLDVAAAFLKMALGKEGGSYDEDLNASTRYYEDTKNKSGMVRLFINVGKKNGVRAGDILGAIAGESGMPGRLVGSIDMYDKYTFVDVPAEHAANVIKAMKNATIKGKNVNVEKANVK